MKTLSQMKDDIAALMKKCADIDMAATVENRDLKETEITFKNQILDEVERLRLAVLAGERQENMAKKLETPEAPLTMPGANRPALSIEVKDKEKFQSFGQQMAAVMRAGLPGGHADPRLFNATGLGESVPSDGGFLVQTDFTNELLKSVWQTGRLASMCRRITISGNANSIKINGVDETSRVAGSRGGGIRGYWIDEASEKTASKPKFRKIELSLKKLIGLCYATDELLDDASALESYIRDGFVSEFGFLIDDAIINGTGAGQPLGVLNAGCLVSQAAEAGQAKETILAENVIRMHSRLFANSQTEAVWLVNQNVLPQLYTMSVAVGTGGQLIYMPPGGLSQSPYGTLLGRPVMPIEQCATLGTIGDIILADFRNGYILAEKGGIKSDMSIHTKFVYDESCFRFVIRLDGQPVRASSLTPYKGGAAASQSHFIALATRS